MLIKSLALRVYKNLPVTLQRKANRVLFPTYNTAAKVYLTNPEGKFLAVKTSYNPLWDIGENCMKKPISNSINCNSSA